MFLVYLFLNFVLKSPIISRYNLFSYTKQFERSKKKEFLINVSEGQFAEWLTEYRALVAKRSSQGDDEDDNWHHA